MLKFNPKYRLSIRHKGIICYRCDCPIEESDTHAPDGTIDNHNVDLRIISGNGLVPDIKELTHKICPEGRRKY